MKQPITGAASGFVLGLLLLIIGCFFGGRGDSSFGAGLMFFDARILNSFGHNPVPSLDMFALAVGASIFLAVPATVGLLVGTLVKHYAKRKAEIDR
jgi:hypothetical protein